MSTSLWLWIPGVVAGLLGLAVGRIAGKRWSFGVAAALLLAGIWWVVGVKPVEREVAEIEAANRSLEEAHERARSRVIAAADELESTIAAFEVAGGVEIDGLRDREVFAGRRGSVAACLRAATSLISTLDRARDNLVAELMQSGIDRDQALLEATIFITELDIDGLRKQAEAEKSRLQLAQSLIETLGTTTEKWRRDPQSGELLIDDEELLSKVTDLNDRLDATRTP